MNNDIALNRPMNKPTKLVVLRTYMLTFGKIKVRIAIATGVVGQYITPKEDVSSRRGLRSGLNSVFIGDQNAKRANGNTQYLHAGSL